MKKLILLVTALLACMLFLPTWMSFSQEKDNPQFHIKEAYLCEMTSLEKRESNQYKSGEIVFGLVTYEDPIISEDEYGKNQWVSWRIQVLDKNGKEYIDQTFMDEKCYFDFDTTVFSVSFYVKTLSNTIHLPFGDYTIILTAKDNYSGLTNSVTAMFSVISYTGV